MSIGSYNVVLRSLVKDWVSSTYFSSGLQVQHVLAKSLVLSMAVSLVVVVGDAFAGETVQHGATTGWMAASMAWAERLYADAVLFVVRAYEAVVEVLRWGLMTLVALVMLSLFLKGKASKNRPLGGSYAAEAMMLGEHYENPIAVKAARGIRNKIFGP
ncbi:protein of unknown function [Magnetospirillum gryphiswaldense MSR-1 v2]|uniref:Uncharacterized protein n=2 Tax=Magnetospirillum gryphiswaldense TaxID=55518 RepID=V6F4D5_MAGGM|nr:protein of unknown function [Magnetospirillum gryphiswaldense MSR-1 v2]